METTAEFTVENQMLFFYLYSTTFQWFSFHSWINSLLYVLSIHWKTLILMNIVLRQVHTCKLSKTKLLTNAFKCMGASNGTTQTHTNLIYSP